MNDAVRASDIDARRKDFIAMTAVLQAEKSYPWYDAVWLRQYAAAKNIIKRLRPDILNEFTRAFDPLRTHPEFGIKKVARVFDAPTMKKIRDVISAVPSSTFESHEVTQFGRLVVHNHPFYSALHEQVEPLVSDLVGEAVECSYNFLSLYSRLGVCEPHMDSPLAKWTLDVCIDQSHVWPIYFSQVVPWPEEFAPKSKNWEADIKNSAELKFTPYCLEPNEAVVFSGSSQWHFRERLSNVGDGGYCNLLFFHFIPRGMRELVRPENWPDMFGMPEIAAVIPGVTARE